MEAQRLEPVGQVVLPREDVIFDNEFSTPDVVDQYVQTAVFALDLREQRFDGFRVEVVRGDGDAHTASSGHEIGGVLDSFWPVILRTLCPGATTRAIDGRAGRAKFDRPRSDWGSFTGRTYIAGRRTLQVCLFPRGGRCSPVG